MSLIIKSFVYFLATFIVFQISIVLLGQYNEFGSKSFSPYYVYAKKLQNHSPTDEFVKITSHKQNQTVPTGELRINGISSDTSTKNCTVYLDWNDLRPFQMAIPKSVGINYDYSTWTFTYKENYHLIINGTNELTAKISCFNSMNNQTINRWSSINVTGGSPRPIVEANITSHKLSPSSQNNVTNNLTSDVLMNDNSEILLSNNILRIRVDGTESNDNIRGIAENSLIDGKDGNDIIRAGRGSDLIKGGRGNDKIYGELGNDILFGGLGDDILTGGKGADIYYCGEGQDLVTDYNSTEGDMRSSDCETVMTQISK